MTKVGRYEAYHWNKRRLRTSTIADLFVVILINIAILVISPRTRVHDHIAIQVPKPSVLCQSMERGSWKIDRWTRMRQPPVLDVVSVMPEASQIEYHAIDEDGRRSVCQNGQGQQR